MKKIVTLTALGLVLATANANAAGFNLREQSAAAQGNAFAGATAGAENISYSYFNVAGLTRHKGTQFHFGGTHIAPEAKARNVKYSDGTPGADVDNIVRAAVAPNMSVSHQLNDEVTLGVSVNVPFGMVTKYKDRNWAGSDHGLTSKVTAVTTTPMVAYKVNDKLSIGAGLPIQYFKAKLSNTANALKMVNPAITDTYTKVVGDTVDVGYQIGAMYEFNENTRVGINYRSEINHKLKGDIESQAPVPFLNQDITARIDTPAMLSIGGFHKINDKWEVMAEYQKVFWNSFDSIDIYGKQYPHMLTQSSRISRTPENWEDANFYALGVSYNVNDKWKIRGGIAYDDAAVRLDYRTPRIPDSRRMWYSAGVGYKYNENLSFDAAYTFIKAQEASIDLPAVDAANRAGMTADYKNQVHMIGLSMNYKF